MLAKNAYLKVSKASDIPTPAGPHTKSFGVGADRVLYRLLEILPGALAWATIIGIFVASRFTPIFASFFIIAFDIYWLFKTVFLSLHLRAGYSQMQRHLKTDWMAKLAQLKIYSSELKINDWRDVYHLIILPFYQEPYDVLRHGLDAIVANSYPKDRMMVVLGCEERVGDEARRVADRLRREFGSKFFKFLIAVHPSNLPGELAGKGSNETYAIQKAKAELVDPAGIPYERIVVSSFDSDTVAPPDYFAILTYHYLTAPHPLRSSYQPIPVYSNNIWSAPAFARVVAVSGTFWQTMQQARPERLATFSSHSMPMKALVEMDFWPVNLVSEDSRIFWQSLIFYDGDYRVVPLYYPVYMDANVAPTLWQTAKNVYRQQRRWGWGVENVPYLLFGFLKNSKVPLRKKLYFSFNQLEGFWSWATNAFVIFLLGWLPVLIGSDQFNTSLIAYNLPRLTRWIMTLAMIGLVTSAYISTRLLPPRPAGTPVRAYLWMVLQWALLPFTILTFGSFPGLEAQTRLMLGRYMGFWVTPKYREKKLALGPRPQLTD